MILIEGMQTVAGSRNGDRAHSGTGDVIGVAAVAVTGEEDRGHVRGTGGVVGVAAVAVTVEEDRGHDLEEDAHRRENLNQVIGSARNEDVARSTLAGAMCVVNAGR